MSDFFDVPSSSCTFMNTLNMIQTIVNIGVKMYKSNTSTVATFYFGECEFSFSSIPRKRSAVLKFSHENTLKVYMNFRLEQGDKVSPNWGEIYGRCEATGSADCLLSSVKLSGCNLLVKGVFVLAHWTGSDSPKYALTPTNETNTDTYCILPVTGQLRTACAEGFFL